jgi:hypothetical protein
MRIVSIRASESNRKMGNPTPAWHLELGQIHSFQQMVR